MKKLGISMTVIPILFWLSMIYKYWNWESIQIHMLNAQIIQDLWIPLGVISSILCIIFGIIFWAELDET